MKKSLSKQNFIDLKDIKDQEAIVVKVPKGTKDEISKKAGRGKISTFSREAIYYKLKEDK